MTRSYKPLAAPKNTVALANQIRWLSEHMIDIGTSIDYYGGMEPWATHGKELVGAAMVALEWAHEIEEAA